MENSLLLLLQVLLLYASISNSFLYRPLQKRTPTFLKEATEEQQYTTASEKFNARWNVMFERLKKYKEEHGDCLVPCKYKNDSSLGSWVREQRRISTLDNKTKGERRDKLNSIGFVWSVKEGGRNPTFEKLWNEKFQRLVKYKQLHGDCHPPFLWHQDSKLRRWISRQRALFANNKLRLDRQARLESIGFSWVAGPTLTTYENQWELMFEKLKKYYQQHGDCNVPQSNHTQDPSLATWVSKQRMDYSKLDSVRRNKVEVIGFIWDPLDQQWEAMFTKLEKYHKQHGNCLVPRYYKEDPSLGKWVLTQRMNYSKLHSFRRKRLEMIGFVWDPRDQQWEAMFTMLEKYRQEHGDCLVPRYYKEDPSLAYWVSNQRNECSKLSLIRRARLDSIGFVWKPNDHQWEKMFGKLEKYRQQHENCLVPIRYKEDPSLGLWVSKQRTRYSQLNLNSTRRDRLESIGFVWDARHTRQSGS